MLNAIRADIESSFTAFMYTHLQGKTLVLQQGYGLDVARIYIHRHEAQGDWKESEIEELKLHFKAIWKFLTEANDGSLTARLNVAPAMFNFEGSIDNSFVMFNLRSRPDLKVMRSDSLVCELVGITPGRDRRFSMRDSGIDLYPSAMKAEIIEAQDLMQGADMGDRCLMIRRVDHRNYSAMVVFLISEDTILDHKLVTEWLTASHQLYIEHGHRMDGHVFEIPNDDPEEAPAKFKIEQLPLDRLKRGMAISVQFFGVKPVKD
jgi:hypothetical protein